MKQAEELAVVWRYVLGITTIDGYSREMTALAEATLAAGWILAQEPLVERHKRSAGLVYALRARSSAMLAP